MPLTNEAHSSRAGAWAASAVLPIFAAALFLSAFLIFAVQPLFAKMVLPYLGGAPAVWNSAMVFFQAALLAGYLYAHILARRVSDRMQPIVHLVVMAAGFAFLPFAVNLDFLPDPEGALAPGVILLFAVSIGFPFFALSANAPLLQAWFARSGHKDAADPYFLYGASNIGSVLALLAYPVVIEPVMAVNSQTTVWTAGYALLAILILSAAMASRHRRWRPTQSVDAPDSTPSRRAGDTHRTTVLTWRLRLRWIAAAAIPSSLMLGVTTHITTNVAAAPFLWVLPLALYLGTFILVFDRKSALPMRTIAILHAGLLAGVMIFPFLVNGQIAVKVALHLGLFFLSALICHNDLASRRPSADRLTDFYLCMSMGGVIGGAATTLLAPHLFPTVFEYPLMLAAACLFLPGAIGRLREFAQDIGYGAAALSAAAAVVVVGVAVTDDADTRANFARILFVLLPLACIFARERPVRAASAALAMALGTSFLVPMLVSVEDGRLISRERSFFGVTETVAYQSDDGLVHRFNHGDTIHNVQLREPWQTTVPLLYYALEGPFGDAVRVARQRVASPRVAVVGLGAGAMACHAKPGEDWRFYEIDPKVARIAADPTLFSYMDECAPGAPVILGDARLTLEREADRRFDLIIIDAFSSDSIPSHLITTEALQLYRQKLTEDGLIFVHVSNRYADIGSVAMAGANAIGLNSRFAKFNPDPKAPLAALKASSHGVAIGPEAVLADGLDGIPAWRRAEPNAAVAPWTDDWSNIVGAIWAYQQGGPADLSTNTAAAK